MASEIERKFELDRLPDRLGDQPGEAIRQGYLTEPGSEIEVRVRERGSQRVITVKSGGGGLVRTEEEARIGRERFESLWELTEGRRIAKRRYTLAGPPAIEVDVYEGELEGLAVAEVEFSSEADAAGFEPPNWFGRELTGDDAYSNARLARYGLGSGAEMSEDPRKYRFRPDEPLDAAARRTASGRVENALEQLRRAREGSGREQADAVHETRKDLKKARSVLRLVRNGLEKERYREQNARLRDAARLLAGPRDAQVKLETLDALVGSGEGAASGVSPESIARLRDGLESERAEHSDPEQIEQHVEEAHEAIEIGRLEIGGWELEDRWSEVGPGLERSYGRGRGLYEQVQHAPDDDHLIHEWRKRVKDLWYHLRLLRDSWEGVLAGAVDELDELADLLGLHHDLAVLVEDVERRMPPPDGDSARIVALARSRQEELIERAFPLADRIYAEKPRRFVKRMRRYWEAWRCEESEPEGWDA